MTNLKNLNYERDRIREHSDPVDNERVDREIEEHLREYAGKTRDEITKRIDELEDEWDIERVINANSAAFSVLGLVLGTAVNRRWLLLPAFIAGFIAQYAVTGWSLQTSLFRRLGFRTREEIDRERYALKALRGDFNEINTAKKRKTSKRVKQTLQATAKH